MFYSSLWRLCSFSDQKERIARPISYHSRDSYKLVTFYHLEIVTVEKACCQNIGLNQAFAAKENLLWKLKSFLTL